MNSVTSGETSSLGASSPVDEEALREYAHALFEDARVELARADSKGSILLTGGGLVLSALTGAIVGGDWTPSKLGSNWSRAAFLGSFAFVLYGIVCIGAAAIPKMNRPPATNHAFFFGHLAHCDIDEARRRIANTLPLRVEREIDQAWWMSKLAWRKYVLIRRSLLSFACAFVLALFVPILDSFVR
jgi:Family of unknown function (DUF5706)